METGTVTFFTVNKFGGYGFIRTASGESLYFQRNDGGPVRSGNERPEIMTWATVREPRKDDLINFKRSRNRRGLKAAPWCFHQEWNLTLVAMAKQPTYRLIETMTNRTTKEITSRELWRGKSLRQLEEVFPTGSPLHRWIYDYYFERQLEDGSWERLEDDPRKDIVAEAVAETA